MMRGSARVRHWNGAIPGVGVITYNILYQNYQYGTT